AQKREDKFEFLLVINKTGKLEDVILKGNLSKDNFNLNNISGSVCDGNVEGALEIENLNSKIPDIAGWFRIEDVDLAMLAEKFDCPGKIKTGKATLDYSFNVNGKSLDAVLGRGFLTIDNADLLPMPLLTKVSKTIGLTDKEIQTTSDATAAFNSKGLELEIEQAYFTNQHEAIVIEPGGIIDLKNRSVDIHVTAIRLRLIGDFIRKVPVIRLFARLKDKLTRLRIEGQWSDPAAKLIKKEPVKDVEDGVISFFTDIADASGQLTEPIIKSTRGIFERK
ncbi:MAG: AsmA-like C-terminal domain-containing protein, partial [Deltaproteobacteria bacterium]|nr:AsmA-like C-terminal domain-containing protein [Deltaproteobacteria bacterium]